jgi:hypothetical protein
MSKILTGNTYPKFYFSVFGIFVFLHSCCSFDNEVAIKEFKELKPEAKIVEFKGYECSGTMCDCWYVQIKYILPDNSAIYDTTLQYWNTDNGWMTKKEFDNNLK